MPFLPPNQQRQSTEGKGDAQHQTKIESYCEVTSVFTRVLFVFLINKHTIN